MGRADPRRGDPARLRVLTAGARRRQPVPSRGETASSTPRPSAGAPAGRTFAKAARDPVKQRRVVPQHALERLNNVWPLVGGTAKPCRPVPLGRRDQPHPSAVRVLGADTTPATSARSGGRNVSGRPPTSSRRSSGTRRRPPSGCPRRYAPASSAHPTSVADSIHLTGSAGRDGRRTAPAGGSIDAGQPSRRGPQAN